MNFKGKTLQEHIWNSMEEIAEEPYNTWDWVVLFEHYGIPVKNNKDYLKWVKEERAENHYKKEHKARRHKE